MRGSSNEREASREQRENRTDFNQEVARLQRWPRKILSVN